MKCEIDVSGQDLFDENYVICVAEKDKKEKPIIKGFKFTKEISEKLKENWKKGKYKYPYQNRKKGLFKVRIYSIILFYIFKEINLKEPLSLTICRDFKGHENDIESNLNFFLKENLGINLGKPMHQKLPPKSKAHWYAYLMSKDSENLLNTYVNINLENIEKYLKFKKDLNK
jgi:hypothetical protein